MAKMNKPTPSDWSSSSSDDLFKLPKGHQYQDIYDLTFFKDSWDWVSGHGFVPRIKAMGKNLKVFSKNTASRADSIRACKKKLFVDINSIPEEIRGLGIDRYHYKTNKQNGEKIYHYSLPGECYKLVRGHMTSYTDHGKRVAFIQALCKHFGFNFEPSTHAVDEILSHKEKQLSGYLTRKLKTPRKDGDAMISKLEKEISEIREWIKTNQPEDE